jgi:hypothetical protein
MDSVKQSQVGVHLKHPPISPLSLRKRARVRGSLIDVATITALLDQAFDFGGTENIVKCLIHA